MSIVIDWENIDSLNRRAKVFGGWLIGIKLNAYTNLEKTQITTFIPDPKHEWGEENKHVDFQPVFTREGFVLDYLMDGLQTMGGDLEPTINLKEQPQLSNVKFENPPKFDADENNSCKFIWSQEEMKMNCRRLVQEINKLTKDVKCLESEKKELECSLDEYKLCYRTLRNMHKELKKELEFMVSFLF